MKKKLSYRDKLVELAYIYDVKEIKDYQNNRKNLTIGQLELILKKNKIVIPKDFKSARTGAIVSISSSPRWPPSPACGFSPQTRIVGFSMPNFWMRSA